MSHDVCKGSVECTEQPLVTVWKKHSTTSWKENDSKTKLATDEHNFKDKRNKCNALLRDLLSRQLVRDINENKDDPRWVHQSVSSVISLNLESPKNMM